MAWQCTGCTDQLRSHLCGICAVGKVGHHLYSLIGVWEFHEGLVLVGSHMELALQDLPKGFAKIRQLFVCHLIWQVADVQYLR